MVFTPCDKPPLQTIVGDDWYYLPLTSGWVAIIELDNLDDPNKYCYVAVRGGRTIGHWSEQEAIIAGQRLTEEVSGRYCSVLQEEVWTAWAHPRWSLRQQLTVPEFFVYALSGEQAERTLTQYKSDPLVTGPAESV